MVQQDKADIQSTSARLRDELAQVLRDAAREQFLKALGPIDLAAKEFEEFFIGLQSESDRGLAIVAFSYIDDKLRELLIRNLNPEVVGGAERLCDVLGPLGTANARIELAAALYWINRGTYHDVRLLRKIRNEFAHRPFASTFDEQRVANLVQSLTPLEKPMVEKYSKDCKQYGEISTRLLYHVRAALTCHRLVSEVATAPTAQRHGLSPLAAFHEGYEKLPDFVRAHALATSGILIKLLGSTEMQSR